jgi:hypothetical protein
VLSIITGGGQWVEIKIPADPLYQHLLLTAEKKFWHGVERGETPGAPGSGAPKKNRNAFKYAGRDRTAETSSGVDRTVAEAAARHRVIEDPFHRGDAPAVRVRPPLASWNAGAATSSEAEGANRRAHGNGRADAAPSPC